MGGPLYGLLALLITSGCSHYKLAGPDCWEKISQRGAGSFAPSTGPGTPFFSKRKASLTMIRTKRTMNDPLPLTHLNAKTRLSGPMFTNVARLMNDRHVAVVHGGGRCNC